MKHSRSAVVGATAVLAAGLVGAVAAPADAQPSRINSTQLHASVAQAVALEKQNAGTISCCPQGFVNVDSTYVAQV